MATENSQSISENPLIVSISTSKSTTIAINYKEKKKEKEPSKPAVSGFPDATR